MIFNEESINNKWKKIYLKYVCGINIVYRDTLYTSFWWYIRVSIFSPSASNQFSVGFSPFRDGTVYIYSQFVLLQPAFPALLLASFPFLSLSISVFSKLYRREIYFRPSRAKPPSPTLLPSASSNTLLSSYSHTFIHFPRRSYSLHPIWGPPRSPIFAVEHTWVRLQERPRWNKESAIGKKT